MAIDEQGVFAGVADDSDSEADTTASTVRAPIAADTDELRRRLETPLFSREPGSMASAQVPGLRELTWDHVTNPTSSVQVVPGESIFGEQGGAPRPAPLTLDEVLPRRDLGLKPLDTASGTPAVAATAPPLAPPSSTPASSTPASSTPESSVMPSGPVATTAAPPSAHAAGPVDPPSAATPVTPLQPLPTPATGGQATVRPPLPSFSDIVASTPSSATGATDVVASAAYASGDTGGVDSLLKPIDEPPPIARETDPLVDGLAELIVRSTPSVGMPRVAELREVSRGDTGVVPSVSGRPLDPPVLDAAVEFANQSTSVPVVPGPEPEITTGTHDAVPGAEVEAEMNRLAFLPDQDDVDEGPVEVPAIAYSDVRGADAPPAPRAPSLSTGEVYTPKSSAAPVRHTYADILASTVVPVVRKRKRHVLRKVLTVVVLLALIGGGMFAVKHFVLDRVQWTAELEPLAKQVETERGLTFDRSLTVTALPADEYGRKLVAAAGYGSGDQALDDAQLRTLGLASGEVDRAAIGRMAMPDAPAFYDPSDGSIYELEGLPIELRTFALHRALTMALLDQRFEWSKRVADQPDVNLRGTVALYDADALAVANALLGDDDALRTTLAKQTFQLFAEQKTASPSPFVSYASSRIGLAAWPYLAQLSPEERNLLETDTLFTDAKVLDLRRLLDGTAEPSSDPNSKGMLFWYHVLAARMQPDLAWKAALAWRSDATTTADQGGAVCTTAKVAFDASAVAAVDAAFGAWQMKAPPESKIQLSSSTANGLVTVQISGCDPGPKVTTATEASRLSLGGAPLRIAQVAAVMAKDSSVDEEAVACAAYTSDAVTLQDERAVIDPVLPWAQVAAHPAIAPAGASCPG